jgi:hypothetical protein
VSCFGQLCIARTSESNLCVCRVNTVPVGVLVGPGRISAIESCLCTRCINCSWSYGPWAIHWMHIQAGYRVCCCDSEASRSVLYPTRLETRTKESNMYASRTVLNRLGRRIERDWYDVMPLSWPALWVKLAHRNTGPWYILFTEISAEL